MKSIDKGKGCIAIEGDREKDGAKEERKENCSTKSRLLTVREPPLQSAPSLAEIETSTAICCVPLPMGPSPVYSHGLDYRFSTPPFPPLAPLDVLPFTTTSFPPLSSSPSCCLSCISIYPSPRPLSQGFSNRIALRVITFLLLADIPSVNITASVQDDAVHGRLWQTIVLLPLLWSS